MAEPIGTALVGYGYAGKTFHAPLICATSGLRLDHIVTTRPEAVRADLPGIDTRHRIEDILDDPSIGLIVLATPNVLHAPQGLAVLRAGKHVVIDKPFALTGAETEELIACARQQSRLAVPFHNRHWDSDFLAARDVVAQGRVGTPYRYITRLDRFRPQVRERWREGAGPGAGLWYDLGPHLLYMTLALFGTPEWISADISAQRPGAQADDAFSVTLGRGALRMTLEAGMMCAQPGARFEIHGDRGSFLKYGIDTQEDALKAGQKPETAGFGIDPVPGHLIHSDGRREEIVAPAGRYLSFYEGIVAAIRDNAPPPVTAEEALRVIRLIEAGQRSAREGRRLTL